MGKRNYTHVQALLPEIKAKLEAGVIPRPKGRPRKDAAPRDIVAQQAYEILRLRMENKLPSIAWTGRRKIRLLRRSLQKSENAAFVHMATAGCGWCWRREASTAIQRLCCGS